MLNSKLAFKVLGKFTQGENFDYTDTICYTNPAPKNLTPTVFLKVCTAKPLPISVRLVSVGAEAAVDVVLGVARRVPFVAVDDAGPVADEYRWYHGSSEVFTPKNEPWGMAWHRWPVSVPGR